MTYTTIQLSATRPTWRAFLYLALLSGALLTACTAPRKECPCPAPGKSVAQPSVRFEPVQWSQLDGWSADNSDESWAAFLASCGARKLHADWLAVCELARQQVVRIPNDARLFF